MEDDFEMPKPSMRPSDLNRWNVEDLEAYRARLLEEVEKVEAIIADKSSVRSAAESLFK